MTNVSIEIVPTYVRIFGLSLFRFANSSTLRKKHFWTVIFGAKDSDNELYRRLKNCGFTYFTDRISDVVEFLSDTVPTFHNFISPEIDAEKLLDKPVNAKECPETIPINGNFFWVPV